PRRSQASCSKSRTNRSSFRMSISPKRASAVSAPTSRAASSSALPKAPGSRCTCACSTAPTRSTYSRRSSRRSAWRSRRRPMREGPVADKTIIRTESAPAPFQGAPYSQAIVANGFVFVSGQLALKPGDKVLYGGTIEEQTEQVFMNLAAILAEAGSGLDRLVKTTVSLQNLDDFQGMNSVYTAYVGARPPARSTVEVAKLPSGALVEIEAIAHL